MSEVQPYGGGMLATRTSRQVGRAVTRIQGGGSVRLARVEAEAEIKAATVEAVTYVGRRAMQSVALLSQLEQQLAQTVPMASGRLAAIGDIAALSMGEVVADTVRCLRRL